MQCNQSTLGMESMYDVTGHGVNTMRQDVVNSHSFNDLSVCEIPNQSVAFVSPSNSSSSMFNAPNMYDVDKVSSVVNMLKGTLERKKLSNLVDKEILGNSSNVLFGAHETFGNPSFNQSCDNYLHEISNTLHEIPPVQVKDHRSLQIVEGPTDLGFEGFVNSEIPIQSGRASQEPSQSESSAAAAVVSSGFEVCDGPSNSTQTQSNGESSRKQAGESQSLENGSRSKGSQSIP